MLSQMKPTPCRSHGRSSAGEVWWVRLDPTLGSEIAKTRPCVIISGNIYNKLRRTVVIIPLSSSPKQARRCWYQSVATARTLYAVTDQIRAVAKQRLDRRIGTLSAEDLKTVEEGVREVLEL